MVWVVEDLTESKLRAGTGRLGPGMGEVYSWYEVGLDLMLSKLIGLVPGMLRADLRLIQA